MDNKSCQTCAELIFRDSLTDMSNRCFNCGQSQLVNYRNKDTKMNKCSKCVYDKGNCYILRVEYPNGCNYFLDKTESSISIEQQYLINQNEKEKGQSGTAINQSHYANQELQPIPKNKYKEIGTNIGEMLDNKQKAYGDSINNVGAILRELLGKYKQEDGTFLLPDAIIDHMALQVRILDKQRRIFNNPNGDLQGENPYIDMVGYSMLGAEIK